MSPTSTTYTSTLSPTRIAAQAIPSSFFLLPHGDWSWFFYLTHIFFCIAAFLARCCPPSHTAQS